MKRQAKKLQAKAKKNQVSLGHDRGEFIVTSSTSGKMYRVFELASGNYQCECRFAQYHPDKECSHTMAVREFVAQAGNQSLSWWANDEGAKRQHRQVERIEYGLFQTSRKGAK